MLDPGQRRLRRRCSTTSTAWSTWPRPAISVGRATEWLADWRTYLGDREAYADALRADPDARLLVSEKAGEGRQITGWIDEFANANRMPSCVTPTDA